MNFALIFCMVLQSVVRKVAYNSIQQNNKEEKGTFFKHTLYKKGLVKQTNKTNSYSYFEAADKL